MRRALLLLTAGTSVAALASLVPSSGQEAVAATPQQPNIILIISDDQRAHTLQTMPVVRRQLAGKGADYLGVIPTSVCCPSRTSLLTGNYSHTTSVYTNSLDFGGWPGFNASGYEQKTIATALQNAGYRTGFIGKYLNYWNRAPEGNVPAGWNAFSAIYEPTGPGAGAYYDYELRGTGPTEFFGDSPADYSTTQIERRAVDFIESAPPNSPYFAMISTTAPHEPWTALPVDEGSYQPKKPYDNPGVNERNMNDKPSFMRGLEPIRRHVIDRAQIGTGEVLRAVDRLVDSVLSAADLSNTLVIYMSDNGVMWGDHRLQYKYRPYRWATEVPLIMRWDGVIAPGTDGMVANIDVAPTILDAAGVPGALTMEGNTVLDGTRGRVLIEGAERPGQPAYCGIRSERYLFVQYANGERELYDYDVDPFELRNRDESDQYRDIASSLKRRARDFCRPKPPGFSWN